MTGSPFGLPVECLLLDEQRALALRESGVSTIGEFIELFETGNINTVSIGGELIEILHLLQSCSSNAEIDWRLYWQGHSLDFDLLCLSLPELERLDEISRTLAVNRNSLGLTGRALANLGYFQIGQLVDAMKCGIKVPAGVGKGKLREFFKMLSRLADLVDEQGQISGFESEFRTVNPTGGSAFANMSDTVSEHISQLSIDVLHVGIKSRLFGKAGIATVGDLIQADRRSLEMIPGLGRKSVDAAYMALGHIVTASGSAGVDWQTYCTVMGLPLLPTQKFATGAAFVSGLHETLLEFSSQLDDPMLRDLVVSRLTVRPQEQSTLEEIAARHTPRVSRERVRQKEKKLLWQLAGALVWGEDHGLPVHFHPEFRDWWRRAADEFLGSDDIDLYQFVDRLAGTWDVDPETLISELPIILAVVTREPQLPSVYRTTLRVRPQLRSLTSESRAVSILHLRLGKRGNQLEEQGISTLGELVEWAKNGSATRDVMEHLDTLADCLDKGDLSWQFYRERFALTTVPHDYHDDPVNFVLSFCDVIVTILDQIKPTMRASRIFRERTCLGESERPTLDQLGRKLGTFGPSVKREETILLEELNRVLVVGDYATVPFWIDGIWLSRFREAASIYVSSQHSYPEFVAQLANQWKVPSNLLQKAAPSLWAVFNGYPAGANRGNRKPREILSEHVEPLMPMRITLRGFRRVH